MPQKRLSPNVTFLSPVNSEWPDSALDFSVSWSAHQSDNCYDTHWRVLPYWVFLAVRKGAYRCLYDNGEVYSAGPNTCLMIPANQKHRLEVDDGTVTDGFHIQYTLLGGLDFLSYHDVPVVADMSTRTRIVELTQQLSLSHQNHKLNPSLVNLALTNADAFSLLGEILQASSLMTENEQRLHRVNKILPAIEYIESHLSSSIRVETLAEMCCMSKNGFSRLFSQIMGTSPLVYINKKRFDLAMFKLAYTNDSIVSISHSSGFCDQFYFSNRFREYVGESPRQYRANLRKTISL